MARRASIVEGGSELIAEFAAIDRPTAGHVAALLDEGYPQRTRSSLRLFHDGRARVAAIINPRLPVGMLGFFASEDEEASARGVLDAAVAWLRAREITTIRGPINYSTWNDYRFVVRETEPGAWFPGEPRHPAYYPRLWEAAGFVACSGYASHWIDELPAQIARMAPKVARSREAGATLRPIGVADLPALYHLAHAAFRDAYMFSPLEPDEFAALYGREQATIASDTSYLALLGDRPVGFVYGFVADVGGAPAGIIKTIAIAPEARDAGIYHALLSEVMASFAGLGIRRAIAALMHLDGSPALMGWQRGALFKQYALYEHRS